MTSTEVTWPICECDHCKERTRIGDACQCDHPGCVMPRLAARAVIAESNLEECREALRVWGWHDLECPAVDGESDCACGFEKENHRLIGQWLLAKAQPDAAKEAN